VEIVLIAFVLLNLHGSMVPYEMDRLTIMPNVPTRDTVIDPLENAIASLAMKERDVEDNRVQETAPVEEHVNT
jgi:hypothetical protein